MIKVIEYVDSIKDGGAETLIKDYALFLDQNVFEVIIVTWLPLNTYKSANAQIIKERGIRVVSMYKKWNSFTRIFHKFCKYWFLPLKLVLIVKKEKPNVLHLHLPILRYVSPARFFLKGTRLFFTCHSEPDIIFSKELHPGEDKAARVLIKNNNLLLIALHEEMKDKLNRRFKISNTAVVHNGIDFNRFKRVNKSKTEIRNSLNINKDAFVVGNIGRLSPEKNHVFLVEVFTQLKKHIPNAFLLIVGDGKLNHLIENMLQKNGLSNSYLILSHRTDIPELLKVMDVFVFPSKFEGLSVTLVEAQVAGLRCFVSKGVNHETFISSRINVLDINDSAEVWTREIMENKSDQDDLELNDDFDINKSIKSLELLYCSANNNSKFQ